MEILHFSPFSPISTITYTPQRPISALRHSAKTQKIFITTDSDSVSSFSLCTCGRRHFLGAMPFSRITPSYASGSSASNSMEDLKGLRSRKPNWYEKLFSWLKKSGMESYEKEVMIYKMKLFENLMGKAENVLEIGIGTGSNFEYYAAIPNISVIGVDPDAKMESYARKSAEEAGLKSQDFTFIHALGESIPLEDASVDAVVGTLMLCSVTDVTRTLNGNEIKRILRPGGMYLFIEHVAAEDGSFLRLVQNVLDPLQQVVGNGCHLTRHTGESILEAQFNGGADIQNAYLSSLPYMGSHVYGVGYN